MADQIYNFNDKLGLMYVINTIKSYLDGYLGGKVSAEELNTAINGVKIIIDPALSDTSTNPVQNMAVTKALEAKAPLANPVFSGTPTAPTPLDGTNSLQIANTAFVQSTINSALAGITGIDIQVVDALPSEGKKGTFYLVKKSAASTNNTYYEYVWVGGKWELIGDTTIDLSGYVQASQLVPIPESEIDAMFADW